MEVRPRAGEVRATIHELFDFLVEEFHFSVTDETANGPNRQGFIVRDEYTCELECYVRDDEFEVFNRLDVLVTGGPAVALRPSPEHAAEDILRTYRAFLREQAIDLCQGQVAIFRHKYRENLLVLKLKNRLYNAEISAYPSERARSAEYAEYLRDYLTPEERRRYGV